MAKISAAEILKNRINPKQLSKEQSNNLQLLLTKVNLLLAGYAKPVIVSSGYRSPETNTSIAGAAPKSNHLQCAAIDIADPSGEVWAYCIQNLDKCKQFGIWLEDKRWTPTWVHLQIVPPKSGKRIFVPSAKSALAPNLFSGTYNSSYD